MIVSQDVTLSEPTLIAVGQGNTELEHEVYLRPADEVIDVVIGGSADGCSFPLYDTDGFPFETCLQLGEELWADGTGVLHVMETHLYKNPIDHSA